MLPQPSPQPDLPSAALQQEAFDALFVELENRLRQKASFLCHNDRSPSINTGDLLSELYLRLKKNPAYALVIAAQGHTQFMAMAAKAMRNILTDAARKRRLRDGFLFISISHVDERRSASYSPEDLLCVHEALNVLAKTHARRAAIIEMRFYASLSVSELHKHFGLCDATIENDIRSALKTLHGILEPAK